MPKRQPITRRLMLQSLGGITIGLPWLEEMLPAATGGVRPTDVPVRAFNVFFGLGIPSPLQQEGFAGVLEPLGPLADKLLIMRGVDQLRADEPGINAHYDGASAAFTAEPPNGTARAGGASLDQMIRLGAYPNGLPTGMIPSLVAGTYFRRMDRPVRYIHSFLPDGTAAAAMQEQPRDLFARIFGSLEALDENDPRHKRLQRSVLDAVKEQANFYTGPRSPLGAQSRSRLADHLDRIREYEQRVFDSENAANRRREQPPLPPESKLLHGGQADPGGEGIDISVADLVEEWRLMADLYALAILTDRVRFGSLTFLAAGERIRLKGAYDYDGRRIFQFDDAAQRNSSGANACSHEWWHAFSESGENPQLRAHAHLKMREVAYFLSLLDREEAREANGRTVLENSLLTISTESGDGRHNDVKRELSGVFHAVTGANGRFQTGQILDVGAEGLDVYNTILGTLGVSERLGPAQRPSQRVDKIIA